MEVITAAVAARLVTTFTHLKNHSHAKVDVISREIIGAHLKHEPIPVVEWLINDATIALEYPLDMNAGLRFGV